MYSETASIRIPLQQQRQYRVPFYQRAYVWQKASQWGPLWKDILRKTESRLGGYTPNPHFLGAVVLEPQSQQGLRGLETYNIIDGQQRLTTLQYLLTSIRIVSVEEELNFESIIDQYLWNSNTDIMREPDREVFKVWPTFIDRNSYLSVVRSKTINDLIETFPRNFTQKRTLKQIGVEHPKSLEAVWYFYDSIKAWMKGNGLDEQRSVETLILSLLNDLALVWITLDSKDDAQTIFETLNGRGARLEASDLIRNSIFQNAEKEGEDSYALYQSIWTKFESNFWKESERRGRLKRPRLEWFIQTALQTLSGEEIEIGRLYSYYKELSSGRYDGFETARKQLEKLSKWADYYGALVRFDTSTVIGEFGYRMSYWSTSSLYPFALMIASSDSNELEKRKAFRYLESFIVRRAICGLSEKNYNHLFLQFVRRMYFESGALADCVRSVLASGSGFSARWPGDEEFKDSWINQKVIYVLGPSPTKNLLIELENALRGPGSEELFSGDLGSLEVEHILPVTWYDYWFLEDYKVTVEDVRSARERVRLGEDGAFDRKIIKREELKHTIGNLTLLTRPVNAEARHREFDRKKSVLFENSVLQLNKNIWQIEKWGEGMIQSRAESLFELAKEVWPGPANG